MSLTADLDVLLRLLGRAQQAKDLAALRFTIVNETHALRPYRQALMFEPSRVGRGMHASPSPPVRVQTSVPGDRAAGRAFH